MSKAAGLNPQILGKAENAHRALLMRILAGTGVTYAGWVALTLAASRDRATDEAQLVEALAGALKVDESAARETIAALRQAALLDADAVLTASGRRLFEDARARVQEAVARLYAGIPPEELAAAGSVLVALTARIEAELEET